MGTVILTEQHDAEPPYGASIPAPMVIIDEVVPVQRADGVLAGAHIEVPTPGDTSDLYSFALQGWAVGRDAKATHVELTGPERVWTCLPIDRDRPDVVSHLGEGTAPTCGFSSVVSTVGLERRFELCAQAVLSDGSREAFGILRGRLRFTPPSTPAGPAPLLVVTLGRTGSTWLMRLLGCHPSIIAYKPFEYEPRFVSYWARVLLALGAPTSYLQPLAARLTSERWWLGDDALPTLPPPDSAVTMLLGRTGIDNLADFAHRQIGATYDAIAAVEGRPDAALFAEKVAPERPVLEVANWLYPQAVRIYLVRDPRDMALSILAYNQRNRLPGFGSERAGSGTEFIDEVACAVADMLALFRNDETGPLLVRYEDVMQEPQRELTRILAHCGLELPAASVEQLLAAASRQLPGMEQHRTSLDANGSVGRWRRDLDPARQLLWTEKFSDVLGAGGYPSDMVEGT